ncbi:MULTISPECIES: NAD(P)H-dependent oxidoreductase [unclassified Caballeronia]|uniref:FMN-dependent NADH-azoreductase n=1 Tax=unclassified Caballeronia TaxID=2646786 RepID=UPI0028637ECC|nr:MULTISPECIES: NAD(P)H-dependent oxidoreductase [unclassified Caballeronia]MDR5741186.1 NAD(P)H-dependent oxidoreductase [Caballeronia sp. LZ016]MDR5807084.1 NAD(P)H-dependent oxidoreductase [Caballeronia sp. LZ019]
MKVLFINASPHREASHGYQLALDMIRKLGARAQSHMVSRDLAAYPLPPLTSDYARAITSREPDERHFELSEQLIREIETTDVLIINTPMHNFTVPAALKLWIDYVLRIHRTFASTPEGKVGLLRDRPAFVIVGSGGHHSGEHALQRDFLSPYLRYALGCIGVTNVHFLLLQGLVRGEAAVTEAMKAAREALAQHDLFNTQNATVTL